MWERERSGQGQVIDGAIVDGTSTLAAMLWALRGTGVWCSSRGENFLDGSSPFYDTYTCADDRHVAVGCLEPQFFKAMLDGLGLDAAALPSQWDRVRWPELRSKLEVAFKSRTRDEWTAVFTGTDACVTPVLSYDEALTDPHMSARRIFENIGGVDQPRPAPRFSRTDPATPGPADRLDLDSATRIWA